MLIQRSVIKYSLYGCDGKPASGRLVYPVGDLPRHIDSGKGCVVTEGESVGVRGLPMLKADNLDFKSLEFEGFRWEVTNNTIIWPYKKQRLEKLVVRP